PNGFHFRSKNIKFARSGTYTIKGNKTLGAYQFGTGESNGFGYHLMTNHYDFETPDTLAPIVEFTINSDCEVDGIVTDAEEDEPEFRSNLALIYMIENSEYGYNYNFNYKPFVAGKDSSTTWTLRVIDPNLDSKARLMFMDRRGNSTDTIIECKSPLS